jgi:ubiquitin-conjugating enzyme E2 Q
MPRKQYKADLGSAVQGTSVAGISDVQDSNGDAEFTFQCVANGEMLKISAMIPEVSDYPSSHTYMIFAPDDAPDSVAGALAKISDAATGKTILQLLELISRELESTDGDGDHQMVDSQDYDGLEDDSDYDDVEEYFPDDDMVPRHLQGNHNMSTAIEGYTKPTAEFRNRIRSDLMTAKANGFKVGHLGGLMDGLGCYISLSCRISKLGISEEAMQAWQVEPTEYLVAIFHYPNGYKSMDSMKSYDAPTARRNFGVRIGISATYKPTMQEAVRAFATLNKEDEKRREDSQAESQGTVAKGFRNSFISRPLNELLGERFPNLLHYRYNGMPWAGAEEFYNDHIAKNHTHAELGLSDKYLDKEHVSAAYPALVTSDHIHESVDQEHSLPLVGMQFVLRHFVRCTEFCLICFTKLPDDLQAIKPYVCDKPLCLYQYMSLGFGPSIEHEILSQPKVVDLLISFCYTSARTGALKDFPSGLSLMVPSSLAYGQDYTNTQAPNYNAWAGQGVPAQAPPPVTAPETSQIHQIRYNSVTQEILFENKNEKCPFRAGEWVMIRTSDGPAMHCRVSDTSLFPSVKVATPIKPAVSELPVVTNYSAGHQTVKPAATVDSKPVNEFRPATFAAYNQNFDDLHDFHKREAVYAMLDILPTVTE